VSAFSVRDQFDAMLSSGAYKLSAKEISVYWFLIMHGFWDNGHQWYGHVDIKMTSNIAIQTGTGLRESASRYALNKLETEGLIERKKRYGPTGIQINDSIKLTVPEDWCEDCHTRGEHKCSKNGGSPGEGEGSRGEPQGSPREGEGSPGEPQQKSPTEEMKEEPAPRPPRRSSSKSKNKSDSDSFAGADSADRYSQPKPKRPARE